MAIKPDVPDDLSIEAKRALVEWVKTEARFDRRYLQFCKPDALRHVVGETLDYHRAIGNKSGYRDWLAVVRNRIRAVATEGQFWYKKREVETLELPPTAEAVDDGYGEQIAIGEVVDILTRKVMK